MRNLVPLELDRIDADLGGPQEEVLIFSHGPHRLEFMQMILILVPQPQIEIRPGPRGHVSIFLELAESVMIDVIEDGHPAQSDLTAQHQVLKLHLRPGRFESRE
jgi:hypothetical protein